MESGLRRGLPIPATNPKAFAARASGTRPKFLRLTVARRRRLFTVFPCAESPLIVDGAQKLGAAPLAEAKPPPRHSAKNLRP